MDFSADFSRAALQAGVLFLMSMLSLSRRAFHFKVDRRTPPGSTFTFFLSTSCPVRQKSAWRNSHSNINLQYQQLVEEENILMPKQTRSDGLWHRFVSSLETRCGAGTRIRVTFEYFLFSHIVFGAAIVRMRKLLKLRSAGDVIYGRDSSHP